MICHCGSEKSRLFLDTKLEAKPQRCVRRHAKIPQWGKLQQIRENTCFFSLLIKNPFYFFSTILAIFGPSGPSASGRRLPKENRAKFTESQNHRMVGVGRDLCGSPSPTPCQSRVTHSRLHRTLSRRVLNISREGDSTAPLGSLGQGSVTLRGKKFFLMFSWNFLCFSLCPLPLVLSLGTTGKSLATSS